MTERLMEVPVTEAFQPTTEIGGAVGRTVLELVAQPVDLYGAVEATGPRPPQTTHTQQRTWDPVGNHPDSRPDIQSD